MASGMAKSCMLKGSSRLLPLRSYPYILVSLVDCPFFFSPFSPGPRAVSTSATSSGLRPRSVSLRGYAHLTCSAPRGGCDRIPNASHYRRATTDCGRVRSAIKCTRCHRQAVHEQCGDGWPRWRDAVGVGAAALAPADAVVVDAEHDQRGVPSRHPGDAVQRRGENARSE